MSSPSIPVVSSADLDEVVVYNSGGEEFEHRRHTSVRDQSHKVIRGGGGGFFRGPEVDQVLSCIAKGGKHGAVCGEGGAFTEWSGKGGILGGDLWEVSNLPALGDGTQQEATWARAIGRASGVSPLFSYPGHSLGMVVKSPHAYSFDHRGLPLQAGGGFDNVIGSTGGERGDGAGKEHIGAHGNGASIRGAGLAGASDADGGAARGGSGGVGMSSGGGCIVGRAGGSKVEGGLVGQRGCFGAHGNPLLGAGASGPLGWCLRSIHIDSEWVDTGVCSSASGVAAGDGAIGEVAGGASAMQCSGPGVMVGGGG
ncbi:hypothetical protein E4T56_gene6335 [Termitomyces sp. T112]|nr:hypothetical protein E4T56_gene6335 [Termitomyces sp. T112]